MPECLKLSGGHSGKTEKSDNTRDCPFFLFSCGGQLPTLTRLTTIPPWRGSAEVPGTTPASGVVGCAPRPTCRNVKDIAA
jgi:hypothetical protein